jgi:hypothetical protein
MSSSRFVEGWQQQVWYAASMRMQRVLCLANSSHVQLRLLQLCVVRVRLELDRWFAWHVTAAFFGQPARRWRHVLVFLAVIKCAISTVVGGTCPCCCTC